jgi:hypothetical protein
MRRPGIREGQRLREREPGAFQSGPALHYRLELFYERRLPSGKPLNPLIMKTALALALPFASVLSLHGATVISEIDLIGNKVEIVNTGPGTVDLTGYFLCNRFTSTVGFYLALTTGMIDLPNSTDGNLLLASGDVMTLQLASGFVTDATGEFGLYLNSSGYTNAANIVDYVAWGADATRDSVAAAAGIWTSGTFVSVAGSGAGQTMQLGFGQTGNSAAHYSFKPATLGVAQSVPEPSVLVLGVLGGVGLLTRRQRRKA